MNSRTRVATGTAGWLRFCLLAVAVSVSGLTATSLQAAVPGTASLSGTVTSSQPFKAAQVYIRNIDKRIVYMVYTQAGRFRAVALFPGDYEISASTKHLESGVQNLVLKASELGGRETPGIGFATGLERLTLNLKRSEVPVPDEPSPRYLVANVGEDARIAAFELSVRLRRAGVGAILSSGSRGLRGQMRQANALKIPYALILGDDEIEKGEVVVRDMESSVQESKPLAEFIEEAVRSQGKGA